MDEDRNISAAPPTAPVVASRFGGYIADGLRYWEPRRIIFNIVLLAVVLIDFFMALPSALGRLSFEMILGFIALAVVANILYCAAYVVDLFVQYSGLHAAWRRGRPIVLTVGIAFAAIFTHFLAKGAFHIPY